MPDLRAISGCESQVCTTNLLLSVPSVLVVDYERQFPDDKPVSLRSLDEFEITKVQIWFYCGMILNVLLRSRAGTEYHLQLHTYRADGLPTQ